MNHKKIRWYREQGMQVLGELATDAAVPPKVRMHAASTLVQLSNMLEDRLTEAAADLIVEALEEDEEEEGPQKLFGQAVN